MSEEPVRLRDGSGDLVLRRDLASARVHAASYDVAAGVARFEAAIAGGAPLPPDPALGGSSGGIVGWGVGTVLAVAVVAVAVTRPWSEPIASATFAEAPPVEPTTPTVREVIVPDPPAAAVPVDDAIARGPSAEPPTTPPDVDAPRSPRARARRAPEAAATTAPTTTSPDPRAEMAATRAAASALGRDPARALELVERADRDFAEGIFGEDRRGIAALAELRLGRADAHAHASAYLRAHPKGTYAERLRQALAQTLQTP